MRFLIEETGVQAGNPVFVVVIVVVIILLSGLLVWSIVREFKRIKAERLNKKVDLGLMTKKGVMQALDSFIKTYRLSKEASVFIFELTNVSELEESFGKKNAMILREHLVQNVINILPKNGIFAEYNEESDSYIILLRGQISKDRLYSFADLLVDTIEKPIEVTGMNVETSFACNLGISFYPSHAVSAEDLISKADLALYMNHKLENKRYAVYSSQFDETEKENVAYYNEIRSAIKKQEFTLYYQPMVDYARNQIVSFEALIRWEHPTLGVLSPNKFLSVLENSGDIIWVGKWEITAICLYYNENAALFKKNNIFFSVNLSVKQLLNTNVVNEFSDICKKNNVPTSAICIEIEEYALYEKYKTIEDTLNSFRKNGFKVAVDHFGLDSNNIMKLEKRDVNMIKITSSDLLEGKESFVNRKINEMLVETCSQHKIDICSLKVEDEESVNYMMEHGVKFFQGYFISAPMDKEATVKFLKDNNWKK